MPQCIKLFLALIILLIPINSFSQPLPKNASLSSYSDSWFCNRGYYKSGNECLKVQVPENGEPNYFGDGWFCKKGFYQSGNECLEVKVPENGKLDYVGHGWICEKGFYKAENQCLEVKVPDNAKLDYLGNGWVCEDGFKKVKDQCKAMTAKEIKKQKEIERYVNAEIKKSEARYVSNSDCLTEYKTGSEVCIKIVEGDLNCHKNIFENRYDSCDIPLKYELTTSYKGKSYIDVDVECTAEIKYNGNDFYLTRSKSDNVSKSHNLYAYDHDNYTMDFHFSFGVFDEITSAKITDSKCRIKSVNLW